MKFFLYKISAGKIQRNQATEKHFLGPGFAFIPPPPPPITRLKKAMLLLIEKRCLFPKTLHWHHEYLHLESWQHPSQQWWFQRRRTTVSVAVYSKNCQRTWGQGRRRIQVWSSWQKTWASRRFQNCHSLLRTLFRNCKGTRWQRRKMECIWEYWHYLR